MNPISVLGACAENVAVGLLVKHPSSVSCNVESLIHSDGWRGYNGLVDLGYKKHFRVHHSRDQFARGRNHINGIESFWSFAKARLMKFYGMSQNTFYLRLKESEFRFNHRKENIYDILLKLLWESPLN